MNVTCSLACCSMCDGPEGAHQRHSSPALTNAGDGSGLQGVGPWSAARCTSHNDQDVY